MIRPLQRSAFLCLAASAATAAVGADGTDRDRLRLIVQEQCLPHWQSQHDPSPCERVYMSSTHGDGYALLHDRKGGAHFLLIPTLTIRGIESPEIRAPGALNYFDAAWRARDVLSLSSGRPIPRAAVGLSVNQLRARSQDQLHIHISCLKPSVRAALAAQAPQLGAHWSPLVLEGYAYQALRLMGPDLEAANPVRLVAQGLPHAAESLDQFTLLVAGMDFRQGPGFVLLAGTTVPGAELMLDASCPVTDPMPATAGARP